MIVAIAGQRPAHRGQDRTAVAEAGGNRGAFDIAVSFTPDELAELKGKAEEQRRSVSSYVTLLVGAKPNKARFADVPVLSDEERTGQMGGWALNSGPTGSFLMEWLD